MIKIQRLLYLISVARAHCQGLGRIRKCYRVQYCNALLRICKCFAQKNVREDQTAFDNQVNVEMFETSQDKTKEFYENGKAVVINI